ncbi:short-chain dehydrogenase/reductase [Shewanella sairae]|uniref:Short-chain dehydrogenase/reductase n=1 Tax=Shewanella sairae TaxID=190310 RepID=A0ABQ4PAH7_9GAMM|nr:SDR family NAD(P)-dependent oxidoreductase [Shewanella sairae]GIU44417.1 short-chain dehydrogenase/reductase [Shewanella sairae]
MQYYISKVERDDLIKQFALDGQAASYAAYDSIKGKQFCLEVEAMRFEGQVAIVTGAASGLGRAYAIALAERGARVVLVDNEIAQTKDVSFKLSLDLEPDSGLKTCCDAINAIGGECQSFSIDVTSTDDIAAMIECIMQSWGRVDILINNAGVHQPCAFEQMTESSWKHHLDVDLNGTFYMTQAVWAIMKRQNYGRVVMSSASSVYGDMYETSMSASKMAVMGLVNSLHLEGADHGITVNSIIPHAVTSMTANHLASAVRPLFSKTTVIATVLYLCSSKSPSGQHLSAAAGGISHAALVEFSPSRFKAEDCTPEVITERWPDIYQARPYTAHNSGEAQVLAWAKASANQRHIQIK